jgi:predicted acetyltransferase
MLTPFYEELRKSTPGFYARSPVWWEHRVLADPEPRRGGATAYRFGVVDGPEGITGYVQYRAKSDWDDSHGAGTISVKDLFGTTPESWAGLWSYVLNHDLIAEVTAPRRSVQDPLFDFLAGPRRVKAQRFDNLWLRVMDVPRALEGRSYSAQVDVVLEVHDPIGDIDGRYRLLASSEGAECSRTDAEPSITLDAEDLGAIYLGRSRLRALSRSGRVQGQPASLAAADADFTWDPQPWCPEVF